MARPWHWTQDDIDDDADRRYHEAVEDGLIPSGAQREAACLAATSEGGE